MTKAAPLPLFGFVNPRQRLPAFLIPIFGTGFELWIQDGRGDGLIAQFSPCTVPTELILTDHGQEKLSARIGGTLIYAFQFSDGHIESGSKSLISQRLAERLNEFHNFPFLTIDILRLSWAVWRTA